jgi:segregation and condensation protein B
MELNDVKKILEALLFVAEQPLPVKALEELFEKEFSKEQIETLLQDIAREYEMRGSALIMREIAGGWQFSSRPEFGPWIRKLFKERLTYKLSNSALETLSIIAYKQPITRGEIEEIRGVEVSAVLDTLMERRLVKIAGRKETIGRPLLYGTTAEFLKSFGLKRLEDLPSVESLVPPAGIEDEAKTEEPANDSLDKDAAEGSKIEDIERN